MSFVIPILLCGWLAAIVGLSMAGRPRLGIATAIIPVLGFCVFGFMATFEPLDPTTQLTWRIVYGTVAIACIALVIWLAVSRKTGTK
jgi:hypothetical protein